ncbi:hypothetical protein M405DRAFT_805691, partial [Rhizopogon salebrosus TDB-379]
MDGHPTQVDSSLEAQDKPQCVSELHKDGEALKQRLLEEKYVREEERKLRVLDLRYGIYILPTSVIYTAIMYRLSFQPDSRLYTSHTTLVAGLTDVFITICNGTFTSETPLSIFGAPSFISLVAQGVMNVCLFIPPLVFLAVIVGKWALGHYATYTAQENGVRRRPFHRWPKHVRANVLSCLAVLPTILSMSLALYFSCSFYRQYPLHVAGLIIFIVLYSSSCLY